MSGTTKAMPKSDPEPWPRPAGVSGGPQSLQDEKIWLQMLDDRNLTVHVYNETLANEIYERVRKSYHPEFQNCFAYLRKHFPEL